MALGLGAACIPGFASREEILGSSAGGGGSGAGSTTQSTSSTGNGASTGRTSSATSTSARSATSTGTTSSRESSGAGAGGSSSSEGGGGAATTTTTTTSTSTGGAHTCHDGKKNGNETDVDCGGSCLPCSIGLRCVGDDDCKKIGAGSGGGSAGSGGASTTGAGGAGGAGGFGPSTICNSVGDGEVHCTDHVCTPNFTACWTLDDDLSAPGPAAYPVLTYDTLDQKTLLRGGNQTGTTYLDLWSWDGTDWTELANPDAIPPGRFGEMWVHDPLRYRTYEFGGCDNTATYADFSEYDGFSFTTLAPTQLPPARTLAASAYDGEDDVVFLYGGYLAPAGTELQDLWSYDPGAVAWSELTPTTGPSPGLRHEIASGYDPVHHRFVVFGGSATDPATWLWDPTQKKWSSVTPKNGPGARYVGGSTYDVRRNRLIMFGSWNHGPYNNDTWEWDGNTWTQTHASGPIPRLEAGMAFDSTRGVAMLFGGANNTTSEQYADTWEYTVFGNVCTDDEGCDSGVCSNHICCATACSVCESCAADPAQAGVCAPIPSGKIDPSGCTCDGHGACE